MFGNRIYLYTSAGPEELRQERLVALDAASGKTVWEKHFSVYLTDIPAHRVAWASPSVDPATGHIYTFGGNAALRAFSPDGKMLWERGLVEDFGAITTHGGRSPSPVVDGDLVVVNALISGWGELARGGNRYLAFDRKTGDTVWVSSPQKRHWDTNYATPVVATINGTRMLIVGGTDGVFHALKSSTGEPIWRFDVSKRAINNSVVVQGSTVVVSHSEENFDTSEMGMLAAFDAGLKGDDQGRGREVGHAWPAGRLPHAGRGRDGRHDLRRGQRRRADWRRPRERQAAVGSQPRHDPEGVAGAGRRQALRRHRERQGLHPQAGQDGRRDPRRGCAAELEAGRHGRRRAWPRADRRLSGGGQRTRLHRVDGRALCNRAQGSGCRQGPGARRRPDRGRQRRSPGPPRRFA